MNKDEAIVAAAVLAGEARKVKARKFEEAMLEAMSLLVGTTKTAIREKLTKRELEIMRERQIATTVINLTYDDFVKALSGKPDKKSADNYYVYISELTDKLYENILLGKNKKENKENWTRLKQDLKYTYEQVSKEKN